MRRLGTLLLGILLAPGLGAQAPSDSGAAHSRAEWRERFQKQRAARIKEALGLSDDQAAKLAATEKRFGSQRQAAFKEARGIHEALRGQFRPGIAANEDSVRKLLDAEEHSAATFAQLRTDERHELATYLSPIQIARFEMIRARMHRFGRHRGMGGRGMRGMGPGGPGGGHDGWGGWQHDEGKGGADGHPGDGGDGPGPN